MIVLDVMQSSKEGVHLCCPCDCFDVCGGTSMCEAHLYLYERLTNLWTSILCKKDDLSIWHN
jgi:hypothetical protein